MRDSRERHFRRNFVFGVLNGALVNFGLAFIDPFTVLPVFITRLGGSGAVVGLVAATYAAGWFLPQLFVAPYVEVRRRVLPIYTWMTVVRLSAYATLIAAVFLLDPSRADLMILAVAGAFAFTTISAGVTGVPFLEVTSKAFSVTERGNFFGARRLIGGALGILAGMVVSMVIGQGQARMWAGGRLWETIEGVVVGLGMSGRSFPDNYGALFLTGAVLSAAGYVAFSLMKEPDGDVIARRRSVRELFNAGTSLLRHHENYRMFFVVRIFWQLTAMAFPFYATFAYTRLGFDEASVGVFVSLWVGSGVVSNYVWGRLGDTKGNRLVLVATAVLSVIPPVCMLILLRWSPAGGEAGTSTFLLIASTFVLNGFARSGRFIANMTYLLEAVPQKGRAAYVGFMNTISFPLMLSPVLGGLLSDVFSFELLFVVSALAAIANTVLSWRLEEPRSATSVDAAGNMPL